MFSFIQTVFKKVYKNSGRKRGTLRFFREKLNRRNVTVDVKHYEDCEQLFYSVGKCYVIEALLEFFQMADAEHRPTANGPHSVHVLNEEYRKTYIVDVIDKFLNEFVFLDGDEGIQDENASNDDISDGVWCYGVNIIKCFLLLADFKDAVSTGNGEHLLILRKQLLIHFFSTSGFNEFAIEMLINILQCEVLLSKAEAHRCKWAATVNWKGGSGRNIEIDLFQENRNCEMKKLISSMCANKTEKAISRASKASAGVSKIVEAYDQQINILQKSSTHSHKSSTDDERVKRADLQSLRPFQKEDGRKFESFVGISHNPTSSFDQTKFATWINRHKKNILVQYTVAGESDDEDSEESDE
jgi:hypothetical protein